MHEDVNNVSLCPESQHGGHFSQGERAGNGRERVRNGKRREGLPPFSQGRPRLVCVRYLFGLLLSSCCYSREV